MRTLQIIVASTRPGRVGLPVAQWIYDVALKHGGFDPVQLVDLAEWNLPLLDEPNHPRFRRYEQQHTKAWSATIDQADAFLVVMPEYNYGYTAPLKNAIDYLHQEWAYKPVGLVSYGGVAAGARAAQMIKQVLTALNMMPLPQAVQIPFVRQFLDSDGVIQPSELMGTAAAAMLDELARWTDALAPLREQARLVD
jgi:NAD(P)H-dependent FMN reductase